MHCCAQSLSMTALRLAALMAWSAVMVHGTTHLTSEVLQWSLVAARHRTAWTMAGLSSSYGGVHRGPAYRPLAAPGSSYGRHGNAAPGPRAP